MTPPLSTTLRDGPPSLPPLAAEPQQGRRVLWIALVVSFVLHTVWSQWPVDMPGAPAETVLSATLTEMPAPPAPVPHALPAKPRPKARKPVPATPPPAEPAGPEAPDAMANAEPGAAPPEPVAATAPVETPPAPPPEPPTPDKTLPPRLDLAYKVFLGTQGFLIGEATYRFEHEGNQYRILTVAQARGLAALFVRGQGKIESRGLITPTGLQPLEFAIERGSSDRREVAHFDWGAGTVTLHEDKVETLEPPSFDPMTLMWQAYFTPPTDNRQTINIVTTRRIATYTIEREENETITWPNGEIETERWHRRSDDGKTDAYVWLAPKMHYAMVKMRITQSARGTVEALLDAIRVEEKPAE